ncbi:MAG: galactokinase [Woeseiaceae bacterium]|nr:galactokinase [Woeseiaceae bacterium]
MSLVVQAPARVNVIGEHTDYNDGLVLPTTTALHTRVRARRRLDRIVDVTTRTLDDSRTFNLDALEPAAESSWINYVIGVAAMLADSGIALRGASLEIDSEIPLGAGLSSSASLELGVALALLGIAEQAVEPAELARLCQRAEHQFAGLQCGIMDQYAIACARRGHAVLIDCRSLQTEQVAIPGSVALLLVDSGVRHQLPDGDYNNRTEECRQALARLADRVPALTSLRDLGPEALEEHKSHLGDTLYRRCRHVVTENGRVQQAVAAMRDGDTAKLGALISASHASLRDDYEVSCKEVDELVVISDRCPGALGSRQVGGGFGGCVLVLVDAREAAAAAGRIASEYTRYAGATPWTHIVQATDPAKEIDS